jgi:hypothetical protein
MAKRDRPALNQGGGDAIDGTANRLGESMECGNHQVASVGLSLSPERYREGLVSICLVLKPTAGFRDRNGPRCHSPTNEILRFRSKETELRSRLHDPRKTIESGIDLIGRDNVQTGCRGYWQQNLMLIGNVKVVKSPQVISVPSGVSLEIAECSYDLSGGEIYLSCREHLFKKVTFGIPNGELDVFSRLGVKRGDDLPRHQIESRAHVVDSVSDDKAKLGRDGLVFFEADGALSGLSIVLNSELKCARRQERARQPIEIVDVLFGPF